jgi:hypothetical protein
MKQWIVIHWVEEYLYATHTLGIVCISDGIASELHATATGRRHAGRECHGCTN